ncbi:hypothetical protein NDU88_003518 [Pleurodeles waltl]|uniref:Uncharacterized protein n=1 Tax=Pleurodeles waltl TaxID=8319 RepID=A0AAV7UGG1_PLEWA|nr:hypothetical protein NDU88_003518 [Pleurodeles waltl]
MGRFGVPWHKVDGVMEKRSAAQQKYITNVDTKLAFGSNKGGHIRGVDWKVGDLVRVKVLRVMVKGQSRFSDCRKIIQVGDSAVKLEDGKWWNKNKLSLSSAVKEKEADVGSDKYVERIGMHSSRTLNSPVDRCRRSTRSVKPPKKLNDYVLM